MSRGEGGIHTSRGKRGRFVPFTMGRERERFPPLEERGKEMLKRKSLRERAELSLPAEEKKGRGLMI